MNIRGFLLLFALAGLWASPAIAKENLMEVQPLSFGEMAITGNAVQTLVISPFGAQTHDPGITPLLRGCNAIFRLTGYPANTMIAVMIGDTTLNRQPSGASFDITAFTFSPDPTHQVTDGAGGLTLKVGATLSTRAATVYADGPFRGTYNLMVNY